MLNEQCSMVNGKQLILFKIKYSAVLDNWSIATLTLPLLMLRLKFINNVDPPLAANDFVIRTNFFNASTHFHADQAPF